MTIVITSSVLSARSQGMLQGTAEPRQTSHRLLQHLLQHLGQIEAATNVGLWGISRRIVQN